MRRPADLKVYRVPLLSSAIGWACAALFFIIGVGVTAMAVRSYPAVNAVVGTLGIFVSLWLAATVTASRLVVTHAGLAYRNGLRLRFIGWAEVRSFGVGRARTGGLTGGWAPWPTLVIHRNDGPALVTHLAFFTARQVTRTAEELATWQRQLG